jgi:hypothetical protein
VFGTVEPPPATPEVGSPGVTKAVVLVVDVPSTNPEVLVGAVKEPERVPSTVPVQAALIGQQATFPAWSNAQIVSGGQHASAAP